MYIDIVKQKFENLKNKKEVIILSIESSCDDTSIAIVKNGREVLASLISSQVEIHQRFGGVVPEVASRNHLLAIDNLVEEVLKMSNMEISKIDAVAVTYGAGLMGSLMIGVTYAKGLAYSLQIPLIKVNHIKGHISANYINSDLKPPFISLVVSGGHTALIKNIDYINSEVLHTTHDDAIGEAFDKVAKVLGLGYPGGPIIDKLAKLGEKTIEFTKSAEHVFSFSGLKTAVINYLHKLEQNNIKIVSKSNYELENRNSFLDKNYEINNTIFIEDICASFEHNAIDELSKICVKECKNHNLDTLVLAGGVSANSYLRETLSKLCEKENIKLKYPNIRLCTDNGEMIGAEAYNLIKNGKGLADLTLSPDTSINLKISN